MEPKRYKRRVTSKQEKIAELIIQNATVDKPLNGGEMLQKVGYSDTLAGSPSRVLNSEGVQLRLQELGFSEDKAKEVVAEIMLDETKGANDRLKATDQVFKVFGSYAAEKKDLTSKGEKIVFLPPEVIEKLHGTTPETEGGN